MRKGESSFSLITYACIDRIALRSDIEGHVVAGSSLLTETKTLFSDRSAAKPSQPENEAASSFDLVNLLSPGKLKWMRITRC